jgi:hypothetical protein
MNHIHRLTTELDAILELLSKIREDVAKLEHEDNERVKAKARVMPRLDNLKNIAW